MRYYEFDMHALYLGKNALEWSKEESLRPYLHEDEVQRSITIVEQSTAAFNIHKQKTHDELSPYFPTVLVPLIAMYMWRLF